MSNNVHRIGTAVDIGFSFRDNVTEALASPTSVAVEILREGVSVDTMTEADARVTIGATLAADIIDCLEPPITDAENTAGIGLVRVRYTPDEPGNYDCHIVADTDAGAKTVKFRVLAATA